MISRFRVMGKLLMAAILGILLVNGCSSGKIVIVDDAMTKSKSVTMYLSHALSDWSFVMLRMWEGKYYRTMKNNYKDTAELSFQLVGATTTAELSPTAMIKVDSKIFNINILERKSFISSTGSSSTTYVSKSKSDSSNTSTIPGYVDVSKRKENKSNNNTAFVDYTKKSKTENDSAFVDYTKKNNTNSSGFTDYTKTSGPNKNTGFVDYTKQNNSNNNSAFVDYTKQNNSNNSSFNNSNTGGFNHSSSSFHSSSSSSVHNVTGGNYSYKYLLGKIKLTPAIETAILNASSVSYRLNTVAKEPITIELTEKELMKLKEFLRTNPYSVKAN